MPDHDWNDLKFFLALVRTGRLARAGRLLGADETTVARRLRRFEARLGAALTLRDAAGRHVPTPLGAQILPHAETAEREHAAIAALAGHRATTLAGRVRISAVPMIVNRVLVPHLPRLTGPHPELRVALIPEPRNIDLTRREADLALRLARPATGGLRTKAQKIGALTFAVYGPASARAGAALAWIGYEDGQASLPQARWIDTAIAADGAGRCALRVADLETAIAAVVQGLGKSLLPVLAADADPRLVRLTEPPSNPPPARAVWMLSDAGQHPSRSVAAAKAWLSALPWG